MPPPINSYKKRSCVPTIKSRYTFGTLAVTVVEYKYRRGLVRQLLLCQQSILSYYITTVSTDSTDKRLLNPLTESADMQHNVLSGHVRHQTCYIVNEKGIDILSDTDIGLQAPDIKVQTNAQ